MNKKLKRLLPQDIASRPKEAFTKSADYISSKLKPDDDLGSPARITNETVAEHRERMLSGARKYIYPLQHSKHKIVLISVSLILVFLIGFFSYTTLALYKFQESSTFLYRVTQVVPFPVARANKRFISYENYLFELRHYIHYYENQHKLDFKNTEADIQQLADYKRRALERVIDDAYVKQLANKHNIEVTNKELDEQIAITRNQNRLGASDKSFESTLKDNFGWSVNDFKRSLKQQLLAQKVAATLDDQTRTRANEALDAIKGGMDFAAAAKQFSDDTANKETGGEFGFLVDKTNPDLPAQTTEALFKLAPGQVSEVVNNGYSLEIIKNLEVQGDKAKGAHILFKFKDIKEYLNPLQEKQKTKRYIRL